MVVGVGRVGVVRLGVGRVGVGRVGRVGEVGVVRYHNISEFPLLL